MDWVDYIEKLASIGVQIAQTRVPSCTQQGKTHETPDPPQQGWQSGYIISKIVYCCS